MTNETRGASQSQPIDSRPRDGGGDMPHVLIVGSRTLLDQTVASLLIAEVDLLVSCVTYRAEAEFIQTIVELQPDVILVSGFDDFPTARIVEVINNHSALLNCRVIVVRPDSNTLEVSERVTASNSGDLLRLIRQSVLAGQA